MITSEKKLQHIENTPSCPALGLGEQVSRAVRSLISGVQELFIFREAPRFYPREDIFQDFSWIFDPFDGYILATEEGEKGSGDPKYITKVLLYLQHLDPDLEVRLDMTKSFFEEHPYLRGQSGVILIQDYSNIGGGEVSNALRVIRNPKDCTVHLAYDICIEGARYTLMKEVLCNSIPFNLEKDTQVPRALESLCVKAMIKLVAVAHLSHQYGLAFLRPDDAR